jgi:argininosuccinate lyase
MLERARNDFCTATDLADALVRERGLSFREAHHVVGAVVRAAAVDPKPRLRYPAGQLAKRISLLRRFAPAKAFDKSLRKQLRLPA